MHRRTYILLLLLPLSACASWRTDRVSEVETTVRQDSVRIDLDVHANVRSGLRAARWLLLRATEARALGLFEQARQDLDQAFHILAAMEADDTIQEAAREQLEELSAAVESTYFALLPHLERFSPDSPLVLLLEGLSEEKIEELPVDATPIVRIHQLRQQCDVPVDANAKVAASIHFFQTRGKETYATWMQRSGRYQELISDILRAEGVPQDLFYIAMIESGFNPRAYSRARAVGLWQFIASTARLEGLERTHWIDERRDPIKSTRAAARHLKSLHLEFQDWRLAAAAYNAGRGRVKRAIEQAGTRNFWELELPRETRNYVPLFMAATLIAKSPERFGFDEVEPDAPPSYAEVELRQPVQLKAAARCMHTSYAVLRDLNPELRRTITPPRSKGSYRLRVPSGKGRAFLECYEKLPEDEKLAWYHYDVQRNDNIWSIAREFGVNPRLITEANSIQNPDRIYQGQRLYIPAAPGMSSRSRRMPENATKKLYTIKPGDSLSRIAQNHGVSILDLGTWNKLNGDTIHPGDNLTIWSLQARPLPAVQPSLDKEGRALHTVQPGETLWGIGRRFEIDVETLKQWNRLPGSLIYPGQKLIVGFLESEKGDLYTVVEGDTLYSIARKFGLRAEELARRNKISLSTTLLSGTTLKIKPLN